MNERLLEIAARIQDQPWNRPGTDKTWVLDARDAHLAFADEVRRAEPVESD